MLAKLYWFQAGCEASEVQWRDILGIVRSRGSALDRAYLHLSASRPGVLVLLEKALRR